MKRAIEDYHNHLIPRIVKFRIGNSKEEETSFGLMIYRKKDAKETDPIRDQYIVFTTNMKHSEARKLYRKIPLEPTFDTFCIFTLKISSLRLQFA